MMNNNKILTVSYGTFSCTLEGFDDSFGTMKAIAEYFRDLASDDRYFGAEPPQPDAEMLTRIAQKEISRRVEAREHEGKIVLSAMEDDAVAPAASTAVAASALLQDAQPTDVDTAHEGAEDPAQDAAVESTPDEVSADEPAIEDVIAATSEDVQNDDQDDVEEAAAEAVEAAPELPAEGVHAPVVSETATTDTIATDDVAPEEAEFEEDENDIVPGQPDAAVEAFFANSPPESVAEDEGFADAAPADAAEFEAEPTIAPLTATPDSIAAKLQRIRAVVAQHDDEDDADDYSEDEHAEGDTPMADAPVADIAFDDEDADTAEDATALMADARRDIEDATALMADARRDIEDALEADEETETAEVSDDQDDEDDDIAAILERLDRAEATEEETDVQEDTGADTLMADVEEDAEEDLLENLFDAEDGVAAVEQDAVDTDATTEDAPALRTPSVTASDELRLEAEEQESDAAEADAPQAPRARVIKVKRADLEAAIQSGELEEYEDEDDVAPVALADLAPAKSGTSSLSAEDEDDLARELAALEADMVMEQAPQEEAAALSENLHAEEDAAIDDVTSEADDAETEEEAVMQDEPEQIDAAQDAADESETAQDEATEDDEIVQEDTSATSKTRRELPSLDDEQDADMNRLLAETDHQMDEPESATRRDAFAHLRAAVAAKKADEAMGVGTDTVESDGAYRDDLADVVRPRRPGRSETRTARPGEGRPAPLKLVAEQRIDVARPAGPVRPRRVAAVADVPSVDGESFAEFAADMGATSLPQMLEAAAAYMSFVEGREQFSRPQLMSKVRQISPEDGFSREDGLRHFGQLLRAGKIEKIKGGRFTVSEDIGFRPDHRAAG